MSLIYTAFQLRIRTIGVCGFALAAGLLAAWAAHEHIQTRERELERQAAVEVRTRLVVATDLAAGTRLQTDHLAIRDIPLPWVPSHSFEADAVDQVLGGVLTTNLKQGDILLPMHIAAEVESSLSDLVLHGRRAVTLPAAEINAVSGLLQPDDLIDLYVSFVHQGQHLTAPLLQGVRVLAIGGRADSPVSITFDASEQDAIKLVAARHTGSLTAMLRHRSDAMVSESAAPGDLAALMGLAHPATADRAPIPVLYGDRVDTETLSSDANAPEQAFPALPDRDVPPPKSLAIYSEGR
ncbi:Flp pilus assembly protein CpaB [Bordetella tumbae]|uniref:Flp pilus assembly protein CpaB n=1 Tax=Bordetella tumbae TaxID=1649139 RepID=UPI0039F0E3E8